MKKKTKIIILIIVILLLIVAGLIIFKIGTKKENSSTTGIQYEYVSDIETVKELEEEIDSAIINALVEVEEDYQSAVKNYSGYTRSDFYNETRINQEMSSGEFSFVSTSEIGTDELYNTEGESIKEVPEITFDGEKVELETDSNIIAEKYYLIRCESGSIYTYYYVMTIDSNGKVTIEWLCYTENEMTENEVIEEEMIENETE